MDFSWALILLIVLGLVYTLSLFVADRLNYYIATQVEDQWKYATMQFYYTLPVDWHDKQDAGSVASQIGRGASSIYMIIRTFFGYSLYFSLLRLCLVLGTIFYSTPQYWWILIPIPLYLFMSYYIIQATDSLQKRANKFGDEANDVLFDTIANVRAVKSYNKEKEEVYNFARRWGEKHSLEYNKSYPTLKKIIVQKVLSLGMIIFMIWYGILGIKEGRMTVGSLATLVTYHTMIMDPLDAFSQNLLDIAHYAQNFSTLIRILSTKNSQDNKSGSVDIKALEDEIRFVGVSFKYSSEKYRDNQIAAVKNINLTIKKGSTTAFVGRSGSGKSTLASLMFRFYDPTEGGIFWDNVDLKNATTESLRKQVTLVPQEALIFNRSVRENIRYGYPDATDKEIIEAAIQANAHEFIVKCPEGYDSLVGTRGTRISGGQKQRLAIARALLTKPSLLILDESTSHLDTESEQAIQTSIKNLHGRVTQIIIAHRLSTVQHADQIVVVDEGKLVAIGKHDELLNSCQIYKNWCQT